MTVMYEREQILEGFSSDDLYMVSCKILDDKDSNVIDLPDSIESLERTQSICNTIFNSKTKRISSAQCYRLREFVANNMVAYGNTENKQGVINLFDKLRIESKKYEL